MNIPSFENWYTSKDLDTNLLYIRTQLYKGVTAQAISCEFGIDLEVIRRYRDCLTGRGVDGPYLPSYDTKQVLESMDLDVGGIVINALSRRWSAKDKALLECLFSERASKGVLCTRLIVSPNYIDSILKDFCGITYCDLEDFFKKVYLEALVGVIRAYREENKGTSEKEISHLFGVNKDIVKKALESASVSEGADKIKGKTRVSDKEITDAISKAGAKSTKGYLTIFDYMRLKGKGGPKVKLILSRGSWKTWCLRSGVNPPSMGS